MAVKRYIGGQWITVTGLQGPQGNTGLTGPAGPAGVSAYYQASAPSSPNVGDVWIDSDEDIDVFTDNIVRRESFTATSSQTTFNTANTFIQGYEQVFMNGAFLLRGTDYTTPTSSSVVLSSGASAGDILEVVTITYLSTVSTYTQNELDSLLSLKASISDPTFTGTVSLPTTTSIGSVSSTEISYLDGVTSSVQTQINNKEKLIPLQNTAPTSPSASDLWVDNTNPSVPVLKVYDGSSWVITGSQITAEDDQIILSGQIFG